MKLIVGLGNPGKEYQNTRHNIGFMTLDHFANTDNWKSKFSSLYTETIVNGEKILLIKPQTYMNLSGNALIEFVNFYKINLEDILVIHDDLDLPVGTYRLKINSSAGGHNGIKSILMTTKMNADINDKDIVRVNNWNEIYDEVEKYKNN